MGKNTGSESCRVLSNPLAQRTQNQLTMAIHKAGTAQPHCSSYPNPPTSGYTWAIQSPEEM
jgi:hypothetical protein